MSEVENTLDYCLDEFEYNPTEETANKLLAVATEYCADEMISEYELESITYEVNVFLQNNA